MPVSNKRIKVGASDVDVSVTQQSDGSLKVTAVCAGETYEHVIVVGTVDQPLPDGYDVSQAQSDLDAGCEFAAHMAESAARRKAIIKELK